MLEKPEPRHRIEVDDYVMKKDVRGTSKDPRATKEEQWPITLQIEDIGLRKMIQTDHGHYDKLKVGDKIKVAFTRVNTRGLSGRLTSRSNLDL